MPAAGAHGRVRAADAAADAERAARRLTLAVARRIDGYLHGDHLGLLPGHGSEPADSREYVPGVDDVRRMDWAVSARTAVPHVRDLIADRELVATAVVDRSRSMLFGTAAVDKRELAAGAVATIGMMTLGSGNRFGAVVADEAGVVRVPASGGRGAVLAVVTAVLAGRPGTSHSRTSRPVMSPPSTSPLGMAMASGRAQVPAPTPLAAGLTAARGQARRRGLVVVVSDFLGAGAEDAWLRPLRVLAARHQVLAVEVGDPREDALPDVGTVVLDDPESGRTREVRLTRGLRERYAAAAAARHAGLAAALRSAGVAHVALRTDRDWVRDLARFAVAQRRTAHAAAAPAGARRRGVAG